jgi:N-acetylglucosamine kinase-like BadF-type ATPase
MRIAMGLDGGGTKTDCVLMDESGRVIARGRGSPSNPSRIRIDAAAKGVREAAAAALNNVAVHLEQITDVCAGLAGVAAPERFEAMKKLLAEFFKGARFELCTDLDLALLAVGTVPAIALVAGTGSAAIGRNAAGQSARSGGHGPDKSDKGSAFAIGKSAVENVKCGAGKFAEEEIKTLRAGILEIVDEKAIENWADLKGESADAVFPRVYPVVARAGDCGSEIARNLLNIAALALAELAGEVQEKLQMSGTKFILGKTGGMIARSNYFDEALDAQLRKIAPQAKLEIIRTPLAEVAARRALGL